jgi:MoaA/NifB/PqqE/SkfB family radical SAM enzyme
MYSIGQIHFEPTQLCQASCPMCDRNKNGGEVNQYLKDQSMSYDQFVKAFSPDFLKSLHTFYMCGNHGDPILAPDMLEICEYIRECNSKINLQVITNGGARKVEWWEKLAKIVTFVNFSVDGLQDTNHLYRQGVRWQNVEENMAAFCDAGGRAKWTFIVFNYNEHQVEQARMFSKILGVDEFIIKKSGRYVYSADLKKRDQHQAVDRKGNATQLLAQPQDPKYRNKAIDSDYGKIVDKFGTLDNFIDVAEIQPKCVKKKEIYVSAEGLVFPCCWLAGQVYKWWRPMKDSQEYQMIMDNGGFESININITPLEEIVNGKFFKGVENSWNIHGVAQGRLKTCGNKCNKGWDPFMAQWK